MFGEKLFSIKLNIHEYLEKLKSIINKKPINTEYKIQNS